MEQLNRAAGDMDFFLSKALTAALRASAAITQHRTVGILAVLKSDHSPVTEADYAAHRAIAEVLQDTEIPVLSEEGREIPFGERQNWTRLWIVDPLDGTKEFIRGLDEFTVNIALVEAGVPILGVIALPARGVLYFGGTAIGGAYRADSLPEDASRTLAEAVALPDQQAQGFGVAVSRSHLDERTVEFVNELRLQYSDLRMSPCGSSVKFCLLAEGSAHIYPRFTPCMEWDTAAGHALISACGFSLTETESGEEMKYNRPNLLNGPFIARKKEPLPTKQTDTN